MPPDERDLSAVEQRLLEMWKIWIDGRTHEDRDDDEDYVDPGPRIVLDFFRTDRRVSFTLLELMAKTAREYAYEL